MKDIPFVLAGSIRDDGPLPDVITDAVVAQDQIRSHVEGAGWFSWKPRSSTPWRSATASLPS